MASGEGLNANDLSACHFFDSDQIHRRRRPKLGSFLCSSRSVYAIAKLQESHFATYQTYEQKIAASSRKPPNPSYLLLLPDLPIQPLQPHRYRSPVRLELLNRRQVHHRGAHVAQPLGCELRARDVLGKGAEVHAGVLAGVAVCCCLRVSERLEKREGKGG